MTLKNKQVKFGKGKIRFGDITFPKHLTPEIVHSSLYIHNAKDEDDTMKRVEYCAKQIGSDAMSYAMALLILPTLMNTMAQSEEYKSFQQQIKRIIN